MVRPTGFKSVVSNSVSPCMILMVLVAYSVSVLNTSSDMVTTWGFMPESLCCSSLIYSNCSEDKRFSRRGAAAVESVRVVSGGVGIEEVDSRVLLWGDSAMLGLGTKLGSRSKNETLFSDEIFSLSS